MSVRHALLALLTEAPKYGLQLRQEFESSTGEVWPLNVGQVYTTLQRLEREGHVQSDDTERDGAQKRFRLTASGERELDRWLRTPPEAAPPPRDELVIKVQVAARLPGVDVHEIMQLHRRHVVEEMQRFTHVKAEADPDDVGLGLVVDAELFRLEAVVRWLDAAGARLTRQPDVPAAPAVTAQSAPAGAPAGPFGRSPAMNAAGPVLCLRQVSKVYGSGATAVSALRAVDLTVHSGELVAIMGPSGSGKSTLLTIAGGLEEPTAGQVLVGGADVAAMSPDGQARLRRRSIGFVFQDLNLLAGLSAVENVALPLELDGVRARTAHAAGRALLAELGLADRASHFPDDLSGGERQRVAIARAVVGDRRLLLADEPTGALDSVNGEAVMRLLRSACKRGLAGVMVTHDAQLASWADRVVFLRDGRVVDQTAPPAGPESLLATESTA